MDIEQLPFTEERVINQVLHYRENEGEWIPYTAAELTDMYLSEQEYFLASCQ